jgi:putative tricarboxylic transport membrane protein
MRKVPIRSSSAGGATVAVRWTLLVLGLFLLGLVAAACGDDATPAAVDDEVAEDDVEEEEAPEAEPEAAPEDDWPDDDIRLVIPADVGGGLDTAARAFQMHWQESLGTTLTIDNVPGANFAIGLQVVADEGMDCNTVAFKAIPHLLFSHLTQDVNFTYEDFYPIASVQIQPAAIIVSADSDYETLDDLIADLEDRPGQVRASVSGLANNNYVGLLQMEELLGVDVNIVGYDGGGPARNAIIAGEVEFTHAAIFAALPLGDEIRFLAIHQSTNEYADLIGDVPTLTEATGEDFGANQSTYGLFAHHECQENYPERYEHMTTTFYEMLESEEYHEAIRELEAEDALLVIPPDEYHEQILADAQQVRATIASSDDLELIE